MEPETPKKTSNAFVIGVVVVLVLAGIAWWAFPPQRPAAPAPTIGPQTGQVVAEEVVTPSVSVMTTLVAVAPIELIVKNPSAYNGQTLTIQGRLGHRTRTGYGWNLKFDLFDDEGDSMRLNGVALSTPTDMRYQATGVVRASTYGPEMDVQKLEKIG